MRHVVFVNPVGVIGGAERVLLAAVDAVRTHARVTVILLGAGPLEAALRERGVVVRVLPLPPALSGLGDSQLRNRGKRMALARLTITAIAVSPHAMKFLQQFRTMLRELRPTLVHSNGAKSHLLLALGGGKVPVVWHVHDFYSERPLMAKLLRNVRKSVSHIVAISDAVKRDVEATLPGVAVTTVRNCVDIQHFSPREREATLPFRVGLVATYANWKGHRVFLNALARLPSFVHGWIVGGPIYATAGSQVTQDELQSHANALGIADRVTFLPFQPDPVSEYRMLDVVVHASTRPEPFGLTIAEAMSCGRAVVVAAAGGALELFTDGVDAIGYTPGDAEDLASAIGRILDEEPLRKQLETNARLTAIRQFAPERFGHELRAVYETTLQTSSTRQRLCDYLPARFWK